MIKPRLLFLLCCLLPSLLVGQAVSKDYLFGLEPEFRSTIDPSPDGLKKLLLEVDYGSATLPYPSKISTLKGLEIVSVHLLFSRMSVAEDFNQQRLNQQRFRNLIRQAPWLLDNTAVEWRSIGQTQCRNVPEGKALFHGFIITYKAPPTEEEREQELAFLQSLLGDTPEMNVSSEVNTSEGECSEEEPILANASANTVARMEDATQKDVVITIQPVVAISKNGAPPTTTERAGSSATVDFTTTPVESGGATLAVKPRSIPRRVHRFQDSTVVKVLERNTNWKEMLVVADVTSSMSPHLGLLMLWLQLNLELSEVQNFTWFNDGNRKPDRYKELGETGGIYHCPADDFNSVKRSLYGAMRAGVGGHDWPENDVEGIIKGIAENPDCKEVVVIVDNSSNMRDYELIGKVNRPVRIILCGNGRPVNTQYLDLAAATGGSVHTIEQDLEHLIDLNEGEKVEIGNQMYQIKKGRFKLIGKGT